MSLPRTLPDWRSQARAWEQTKYNPYDVWRPLIPFFQSHGLTLWDTSPNYLTNGYYLVEPKDAERAPDGFAYLSGYFPDGPPPMDDYFQYIVRRYVHYYVL